MVLPQSCGYFPSTEVFLIENPSAERMVNLQLDDYGRSDIVLCPSCGVEYNHIVKTDVWQGDSVVEVLPGNATSTRPMDLEEAQQLVADTLRGSAIVVHTWCEGCGETSQIVVRFHKGQTLVHAVSNRVSETVKETDEPFSMPDEFWRD